MRAAAAWTAKMQAPGAHARHLGTPGAHRGGGGLRGIGTPPKKKKGEANEGPRSLASCMARDGLDDFAVVEQARHPELHKAASDRAHRASGHGPRRPNATAEHGIERRMSELPDRAHGESRKRRR